MNLILETWIILYHGTEYCEVVINSSNINMYAFISINQSLTWTFHHILWSFFKAGIIITYILSMIGFCKVCILKKRIFFIKIIERFIIFQIDNSRIFNSRNVLVSDDLCVLPFRIYHGDDLPVRKPLYFCKHGNFLRSIYFLSHWEWS